jgi:hypothetical protein
VTGVQTCALPISSDKKRKEVEAEAAALEKARMEAQKNLKAA